MNSLSLSIIIADDHHLVRHGLANIIHQKSKHTIVAQASNGKELVDLVEKLNPDIVITDIKMPMLDGIQATKQIKKLYREIEVIALSFMDNEFAVVDILEAGALGYLNKSSNPSEILEAITKVYNKVPFYCTTTTSFLLKQIAKSSFDPYKKFKPIFTEQEVRIIRLISKGKSTKEISEELEISTRTVDAHRRNILDHLEIKSAVGVIIYAIKNGIMSIDDLP